MKVSVIIPAYNNKAYIEDCIHSVSKNPHVGEVIIIDDGSTDGTYEICLDLQSSSQKIEVITHSDHKNLGSGRSRNLGIVKASCQLINFLDSDDFHLPQRFDNTIPSFHNDPSLDGIYETVKVLNTDPIHWDGSQPEAYAMNQDIIPEHALAAITSNLHGTAQLNGFTFKTDFLKTKNIYCSNHLRGQELNLIFKACAEGNILLKRSDPVSIRRLHSSNVSLDKKQEFIDRSDIQKTWIQNLLVKEFKRPVNIYFFLQYLHYRPIMRHIPYRIIRNLCKIPYAIIIFIKYPKLIYKLLA